MTEETVPRAVRLVRDFVNTYEPQTGAETLVSPDALQDWLVHRGLMSADAEVTEDDLGPALVLREGLRNVLLGHAGHDADPDAIEALHTVLIDLPVRLDLRTGHFGLVSTRTDPLGQALGRLLDAVHRAGQDGTWARLKVCARDTCRWAYFDASRNQVRRWCSMAGCGNQAKMRRAYATRKAQADSRH